jgi:hypothetical protein
MWDSARSGTYVGTVETINAALADWSPFANVGDLPVRTDGYRLHIA